MSFFSTVLNQTVGDVNGNDLDSYSDSDSDSDSDFDVSDSYHTHLDFLKAFNDLIFSISVFYKLYDGSNEFTSESITIDSIIEDIKEFNTLHKTVELNDIKLLFSEDWYYVYFARNFPELQDDDPRYIDLDANFLLKLLKGIFHDGAIDDIEKQTIYNEYFDRRIILLFKDFINIIIDKIESSPFVD